MAEHRVPMLGAALRRRRDPERSRDPQIRELVAALATLEVAPELRPDFRAELRAQLVAVTPRLVEEGEPAVRTQAKTGTARRAAKVDGEATRRSGFRFGKPLIAVTSALVVIVLLLGGAVLLSQRALPGDALYGLKRASENTQYGLAGGTVAKGKLKLEFAGRRIGEVSALLPRASALGAGVGALADNGQLNGATSKLIRDTLGSADSDVRTAAQLLGGAAVHGKSAGPLNAITNWSPKQIKALDAIVARLPAGNLHERAVSTLSLLKSAQLRAATLRSELNCGCLGSSGSDDLGPLPCTTACSSTTPGRTTPKPARSGTKSGSSGATTHPVVPRLPTGTSTAPAGGGTTATSAPPGKTSGPGPSTPGVPITAKPTVPGLPSLPGLPGLPTLPGGGVTSTPALPITVNSCGVHASLGPIQVGIGSC